MSDVTRAATTADPVPVARAVEQIVGHFGRAVGSYEAPFFLCLAFETLLALEARSVTIEQRNAVLAAIARVRPALADMIPKSSLERVEDALDAVAEDVASSSGLPVLDGVESFELCRLRILLGQAETAAIGLLVSSLFGSLEDRPRRLMRLVEYENRCLQLAADIAERTRTRKPAP